MNRWQELDERQQKRFPARPEVDELQQYSKSTVLEAVGKHQKLTKIRAEAKEIDARYSSFKIC
jgi:hypothetical protein